MVDLKDSHPVFDSQITNLQTDSHLLRLPLSIDPADWERQNGIESGEIGSGGPFLIRWNGDDSRDLLVRIVVSLLFLPRRYFTENPKDLFPFTCVCKSESQDSELSNPAFHESVASLARRLPVLE
ncbi:uncharacterized protein ARMOST_15223 [Armillaria ostoyae]|uniref:Uncharacterized protein n=1 Tax=Armillaria ostoyae TaxID=47428 RepID=A0A284RSS0_ARMOS|nr:uncharacterized protein ARMOST_15223 [Armillaria ostoyae]